MVKTANPASPAVLLVLVWSVILPAGPAPLQAAEVPEANVATAIETWVRHVTADARPDAVVETMEPYTADGQTVAYIVHLESGGFCLCGADDRLLPVYLYNPTRTFQPDDPNYQYILEEIGHRLAKLEEAADQRDEVLQTYAETLEERVVLWDDLVAGSVPEKAVDGGDRADPVTMELPVTSYWHQGPPYNDQTPVLTPGWDEHTVVGCVGTASAQIMYYWQWPYTGTGTGSTTYDYRYRTTWDYEPLANDPNLQDAWWWAGRLEWVSSDGGQLRMNGYWDGSLHGGARNACNGANPCNDADYLDALENLWGGMTQDSTNCFADFGATTYNWGIMQDVHEDPADAGDAEAAELSYHAAVAVGMGFGLWGSSSHTSIAANALPDHFRYDNDAVFAGRNVNTMVTEIQWLRPVQLGGQSDSGGHSWVVCGYNKNTSPWQFLMNMGWGGGSTDWYSVDEVFPNDSGHTTRIAPEGVVEFVGGGVGGDGSPGNPYQTVNTALASAPDGTTLIFKAGTTHTYPGSPLVIDRPLTIKGRDVTIQVN